VTRSKENTRAAGAGATFDEPVAAACKDTMIVRNAAPTTPRQVARAKVIENVIPAQKRLLLSSISRKHQACTTLKRIRESQI
jgi:hypothetical protein